MADQGRRKFLAHAGQFTAAAFLYLTLPAEAVWGEAAVSIVVDRHAAGLGPRADCTSLLQQAIDRLPPLGGEIVVAAGEYLIDPVRSVVLRSHVKLRLLPGALLRAVPVAAANYAILRIQDASNVSISGGSLVGDRDQHLGTAGEWGMGVDIRGSHTVLLEGVHISKCWGDGVYVGESTKGACSDITLRNVVAEENRRQGLSIVACSGALIEQCEFNHTGGTAPAAGVDLEPNADETVENVRIVNCAARGNQGDGFQFYAAASGAQIRNSIIDGGISTGNKRHGISLAGTSNCEVMNVQITDNASYGVYVKKSAQNCTISSNKIAGNSRASSVQALITKALHHGASENIMVEDGARNIELRSNVLEE